MSLKALHIVFVIASCLVTAFFGWWSWSQYLGPESAPIHRIYGVGSILLFIGLLAYGRYFLKKLRRISYL